MADIMPGRDSALWGERDQRGLLAAVDRSARHAGSQSAGRRPPYGAALHFILDVIETKDDIALVELQVLLAGGSGRCGSSSTGIGSRLKPVWPLHLKE